MRDLRRGVAARPIHAGVCPGPPVQGGSAPQAQRAVSTEPPLRGAQRQPRLRSNARERDSLFQMGTEGSVPIKGALPARLGGDRLFARQALLTTGFRD
jgi:hypothetical protein